MQTLQCRGNCGKEGCKALSQSHSVVTEYVCTQIMFSKNVHFLVTITDDIFLHLLIFVLCLGKSKIENQASSSHKNIF